MNQKIFRNKELISEADVHLVSVNESGKPSKLPNELKEKIEN